MKNCTAVLTVLFLTLGAATFAQPGNLDGPFGTGGKVTTDFGTEFDLGFSVAIQSDGKIIVAGSWTNLSTGDFAIARYNTDGSLDNSFGVGGMVSTVFGTLAAQAFSVAIQSDGKIIVAGNVRSGTDQDFAVARLNTDGSLDSSFGVDGKVTTDFGTTVDVGYAVAIQSDGMIIVGGYGAYHFALARYNMDGSLDNSFGSAGKVTTALNTGGDTGYSVALQPDGKIVLAGTTVYPYDFALVRYNMDGSLDTNFGGGGIVSTDFGTVSDNGASVAIQMDGKILIAGSSGNSPDKNFALARYNSDGTLDSNFGVDGKLTCDFGMNTAEGRSVTIQPDGKVIVGGSIHNGSGYELALARFNGDGSFDNSFGVDGKVTTSFGTSSCRGNSVAFSPDGKIVLAGTAVNGTDQDFAVARYISGLNVGIIDLSLTNATPLIYPNPIAEHATLEYTLQNAELISVHLFDMQGKMVQTFIERQHQAAGEHQQAIDLREDLPAGSYLLAISSAKGRLTVQVVK